MIAKGFVLMKTGDLSWTAYYKNTFLLKGNVRRHMKRSEKQFEGDDGHILAQRPCVLCITKVGMDTVGFPLHSPSFLSCPFSNAAAPPSQICLTLQEEARLSGWWDGSISPLLRDLKLPSMLNSPVHSEFPFTNCPASSQVAGALHHRCRESCAFAQFDLPILTMPLYFKCHSCSNSAAWGQRRALMNVHCIAV